MQEKIQLSLGSGSHLNFPALWKQKALALPLLRRIVNLRNSIHQNQQIITVSDKQSLGEKGQDFHIFRGLVFSMPIDLNLQPL
jgi:hypothetical protein